MKYVILVNGKIHSAKMKNTFSHSEVCEILSKISYSDKLIDVNGDHITVDEVINDDNVFSFVANNLCEKQDDFVDIEVVKLI